jgi:hypothetical protein
MITQLLRVSAILLALAGTTLPGFAQTRLVNMVPNSRSGETNQDAEPTITVDPNNFQHMAGSAFTSDNLAQNPMVTDTAPIYVSTDGGNTWTLAFIVPSRIGGFPTGDITLSFSSRPSGAAAHKTSWLYGGILRSTATGLPMTALRSQDPFSSTLMTVLDTRSGHVDQPHTIAKTGGKEDRLYIGFNNGFGNFPCPPPVAPNGRSSTLDVSQDASIAAPTFTLDLIEARNSNCQNGFAQVPAVHKDGTVYAAFIHDWSAPPSFPTGTPRLVVVRDDHWGSGASPFTALKDPSDTVAGRFVTAAITMPSGAMGQNRLGASNVSIAVDPNNSDRVYLAWGEANGSNSETIHVRRSIDRGHKWSKDLLTVTSAMNPEIAINNLGIVGVLFQSVTAGKWETRLVLSNNLDATTFATPGTLLASQSASTPLATFSPYLGDYASLVAAGNSFVGMFSASNFPDKANFMTGVKYQREVDWTTHKLFADAAHTTVVAPSIDPFFFEITTNACSRSRFFCNICEIRPVDCFPIYDPWWWLKCPACGITIYVDPGDEFEQVAVYDSLGKEVGRLERLTQPVVENGVTYTYAVKLKLRQGVGYVLKATRANAKSENSFMPQYSVRLEGKERQ